MKRKRARAEPDHIYYARLAKDLLEPTMHCIEMVLIKAMSGVLEEIHNTVRPARARIDAAGVSK